MIGPIIDEQDHSDIAAATRVTADQTGLEPGDYTIHESISMTYEQSYVNLKAEITLYAAQLDTNKLQPKSIFIRPDLHRNFHWMTKDIILKEQLCVIPFKNRIVKFEETIRQTVTCVK